MRSSNLWQGVVGYWSATAGPTGYRLLDRSGRGNHGTLTNMDAATDWVVNGGRYALDLDGSDDLVSIADSDALSGLMPISLSFWVRPRALPPASQGQRMFLVTKGAASNYEWDSTINFFNSEYGKFTFYSATLNGLNYYGRATATNAVTNEWQFLVFTQSEFTTHPNAYLNGKLDNGGTFQVGTGSAANGTAAVMIGARADNAENKLNGQIDQVIIYNRALSAGEIAQLYQIGRGGMLTPRRRRRAYSVATGLRRRLLLTGQV
jgi:hypothetical protein